MWLPSVSDIFCWICLRFDKPKTQASYAQTPDTCAHHCSPALAMNNWQFSSDDDFHQDCYFSILLMLSYKTISKPYQSYDTSYPLLNHTHKTDYFISGENKIGLT